MKETWIKNFKANEPNFLSAYLKHGNTNDYPFWIGRKTCKVHHVSFFTMQNIQQLLPLINTKLFYFKLITVNSIVFLRKLNFKILE